MPSDKTASTTSKTKSDHGLDVHYMASRLRTDTWDALRWCAQRMSRAAASGRDLPELIARAEAYLETLEPIETYWVFPGQKMHRECRRLLKDRDWSGLDRYVSRLVRMFISETYRSRDPSAMRLTDVRDLDEHDRLPSTENHGDHSERRPYFEVLVVDEISAEEEAQLREDLLALRREEDGFIYDILVVPTFEDAMIAILFNHNIQSVVIRYDFPLRSRNSLAILNQYAELLGEKFSIEEEGTHQGLLLGNTLTMLRPELDTFLVTDAPVEEVAGKAGRNFRRVFYRQEDYLELHLSILKGIGDRYETPFFNALRKYSQKPTGVFHAMPLSRGKSISKSHWIKDMGRFYGTNIFLAETSSTGGGLDSLLQPHGALKSAQSLAARAFHAQKTFFVTNGTSTANKIVMQALVRPGDLALVSRDCHKSHHYALILSGAQPVYLDSYPLPEFSMYGAVPLKEIKSQLLKLRAEGKLDRVRMLLLTNCTFDGIVYNPMRVMEEVLAIKPDMIFLWDEAWFAYAGFTPITRQRTGMWSASLLREKFKSAEYRDEYKAWKEEFGEDASEERWLNTRLWPDPAKARVRVYSTQSTHKTLTALRQGSMIHIYDQDYERNTREPFMEAYMTHTSTSPNYQILASLDVGRRQMELEGYELVQKSIELAMMLREQLVRNPQLNATFHILGNGDLIPLEYRESGLNYYYDADQGWARLEKAWATDEFVLDPTRVTVHCGWAGLDGNQLRNKLIDDYDIQINKTSRNTVLFMIHIGMTRGTLAYLIEVLAKMNEKLTTRLEGMNDVEMSMHRDRVKSLTKDLPPLPNFSRFHDYYREDRKGETREGDMRRAYFDAYDEDNFRFLKIGGEIEAAIEAGEEIVSASFVTPYPPGFPVLVPGQVISPEILAYLRALDVTEIHGYEPQFGFRVFRQEMMEGGGNPVAAEPIYTTGKRKANTRKGDQE